MTSLQVVVVGWLRHSYFVAPILFCCGDSLKYFCGIMELMAGLFKWKCHGIVFYLFIMVSIARSSRTFVATAWGGGFSIQTCCHSEIQFQFHRCNVKDWCRNGGVCEWLHACWRMLEKKREKKKERIVPGQPECSGACEMPALFLHCGLWGELYTFIEICTFITLLFSNTLTLMCDILVWLYDRTLKIRQGLQESVIKHYII